MKYNRYYPTKEIGTCFNDILGIRIIIHDYNIDLTDKNIRHVDMSNGKKNDDGYRGYHIYYKKSDFHYLIEVQFFTERDYIFNMWLHKYVYKYKDNMIGIKLKDLYDKGIIQNEDDLLNYKLDGKEKQVVLLSNLEMWKEYEPFNMTNSVGEFIDKAMLN